MFPKVFTSTIASKVFKYLFVSDGRKVSFCGDLHPHYHGSVVKALASSQYATPHIMRSLTGLAASKALDANAFIDNLAATFNAYCTQISPCYDGSYHLVLRCPWLAKKAQPGHMFRLARRRFAHYHKHAMTTQAVALKVAGVELDQGLLHFIFSADDVATTWLAQLETGEQLNCMGVTGVRLSTPKQSSHVLLITDQQGMGVCCF